MSVHHAAYTGWLLLAFLDELNHDVTPATVGSRPLAVVRHDDRVRVVDAVCPHRGANLGFGGTLEGEAIRCPFHGRVIKIGRAAGAALFVHEYRTLVVDGLVFVLLDERQDRGFGQRMDELRPTHRFCPGFALAGPVPPELVIENAFDVDHFVAVHDVAGMEVQVRGDDGTLVAEGVIHVRRPNRWQVERRVTRFVARAVSPMLVVTELGEPEDGYTVFTSATPTATGCVIRVAVAARRTVPGELVAEVVRDSHTAFVQDLTVWEHLVPGAPEHLDSRDAVVSAYRRFCRDFVHVAGDLPRDVEDRSEAR